MDPMGMIKQKRDEMNHLIFFIMSLIDEEKWIHIRLDLLLDDI